MRGHWADPSRQDARAHGRGDHPSLHRKSRETPYAARTTLGCSEKRRARHHRSLGRPAGNPRRQRGVVSRQHRRHRQGHDHPRPATLAHIYVHPNASTTLQRVRVPLCLRTRHGSQIAEWMSTGESASSVSTSQSPPWLCYPRWRRKQECAVGQAAAAVGAPRPPGRHRAAHGGIWTVGTLRQRRRNHSGGADQPRGPGRSSRAP